MVFVKCVVDPDTFQSYPYGCIRPEFEDLKNIDILVGLWLLIEDFAIKTVFFLILKFLNRYISVKTNLINTKLGNFVNLVCSFWLYVDQ